MISNCCSAPDRAVTEDGPDFSDIGICPECKDHCTFDDYSEYDGAIDRKLTENYERRDADYSEYAMSMKIYEEEQNETTE